MDDIETAEAPASSAKAYPGGEALLPALLIAWSAEPGRVGEVALFEPGAGAKILGRGTPSDGSEAQRVVFGRQRPSGFERRPSLGSPGLSREQLRIRPEGQGLRVERIGKCPLEVQAKRVDDCVVQPGDLLLLKGQLLLYCTQRPFSWMSLHSVSSKDLHVFGEADAHGIVGESFALWKLRDELSWAAKTNQHTLLLGESGTGKELAARAIHCMSDRLSGPFIARSAATIPESLMDAELFGNTKNYPNPGMPERPGLIGAAHGGTLFLDEIGELPHRLQANLLRVLDEGGEYHNLGSSIAKRSNFRLIAATNRELCSLKHDMGARLVLRLRIPTLNERREDIPSLIHHLLKRASLKNPEALRRFLDSSGEIRLKSSVVEQAMKRVYSTHIRELDAFLWQAMGSSSGEYIEWKDSDKGDSSTKAEELSSPMPSPHEVHEAPEPTAELIRSTLGAHQGNIARTARALGLSSRYVLYRLMRKYGIEVDESRGDDG